MESQEKQPISIRSMLWRGFKRLLLVLLILWIVLTIAIQIPAIQGFIIDRFTNQISKRTQTTIRAEGFRLKLFNSISLNDFYIEDHNGDTLLFANDFELEFENPIYSYLQGKDFLIKGVKLNSGGFYQRKLKGETLTNLEVFLDALGYSSDENQSQDKSSEGLGIAIDLNEIVLQNAEFVRQDSVVGSYQRFALKDGLIIPDRIDFDNRTIIVKDIILETPQIELYSFPGTLMEFEEEARVNTLDPKGVGPDPWLFQSRQMSISEGVFRRYNYLKEANRSAGYNALDFNRLDLDNIFIDISDFNLYNWNFDGCLNQLSGETSSGFDIENFSANYIHVDTGIVDLEGVQLETPGSEIIADVELTYSGFSAFREFVDEVDIAFVSQQAEVQISDLMQFVPRLNSVRFFRESKNQLIKLRGNINGPVNKLNGKDVILEVGEFSRLDGNFSSTNLSEGDKAYLKASIDRSTSSIQDLSRIIPGFSTPENFQNLGRLNFSGKFEGSFKDFSAEGDLMTDIGQAGMKINMDVREGADQARYSGGLELINFDLGAFSENEDLGIIDLYADVREGQGLRLESLSTRILATVEGFSYKGYTLNNFNMNGTFDGPLFNGKFDILDEFLDFSFRGKVDLSGELPQIDIDAKIGQMHLGELQLTEKDIQVSGDVVARIDNYKLNKLDARIELKDFTLIQNDTIFHEIDSLSAVSRQLNGNRREIQVDAPQLDFSLQGIYKPTHLWPSFKHKFQNAYPEYAEFLDVKYDTTKISPQNFSMTLNIHDTENWLQLIQPDLDSIYSSNTTLFWDDEQDSIYFESFIPHFRKGNQDFHEAYVYLNYRSGLSNLVSYIDSASFGERFGLESFTGQFDLNADTLFWSLNLWDENRSEDRFNFDGKSFLIDSNFALQLIDENLEFFYDSWTVNPKNVTQVNREFIRLEDFDMTFEDRTINLNSINDQGLSVGIENIELSLVNDILVSEKFYFGGLLSATIYKPNIYETSALRGDLNIFDLLVNGDEYGDFKVSTSSKLEDDPLRVSGALEHPDHGINFDGFLFAEATGITTDFYALDLKLDRLPMKILTYLVQEGISDVEGHLTGKFSVSGKVDQPIIKGEGLISNGAVTIDFLGTRLFIENQLVRFAENSIDASGSEVLDIYGNPARLTGGITHDYFKDLSLDLFIESDNFLLLNTTEDDEIMYYGHCMGDATVDFSGALNSPNITVNAESKENTRFYLRTDYIEEDVTAGFLRFDDFSDTTDTEKILLDVPKGINFSLNLVANDRAQVEIIIDQKTGDIIRGRGRGNIQFNLNRAGEITMFGDYEITNGQYLFTSQVLIQKPFKVSSGSTIQWTGDPLGANINIKAEYSVFTSPYFLVQEMVTQPDQIQEFQNNTEVILIVELTGPLYSPQLAFSIEFPNLTGPAKSIVENKLTLLESDPNEMYKQAGALIVLNTFVPSAVGGGQALGAAAGVNTLSEFVSSQFSNVLSDILRTAVEDVEFIDDIDLDLNYNVGTDDALRGEGFGITSGQFRVSTTARLFDRVELDVGTNYFVGNANSVGATESGTFFTGNFALQYALTEDRQLMLRVYSLSDQVLEGRRFRSGVGIRHQKEFDSFDSFYSGLENAAQKLRLMPSPSEEEVSD